MMSVGAQSGVASVRMELDLFPDSPEARRASELARELLTSRAMPDQSVPENTMPPLHIEALQRVLEEVLLDAAADRDLAVRVGYLVAALSTVATLGVWSATGLLADAYEVDRDEALQRILEIIAQHMEERDTSL